MGHGDITSCIFLCLTGRQVESLIYSLDSNLKIIFSNRPHPRYASITNNNITQGRGLNYCSVIMVYWLIMSNHSSMCPTLFAYCIKVGMYSGHKNNSKCLLHRQYVDELKQKLNINITQPSVLDVPLLKQY